MALVRDPYFWKRFSTAVHQDDEAKTQSQLDLELAVKKSVQSLASLQHLY